METVMRKKFRLTTKQTLAVSFAGVILVGSILLTLPIAGRNGDSIPYLNALFTAASATCVTGLVVYDTWTQFSLFGQVVILMLIQIGALGFMTMTMLFALVVGKRIGLKERSYLMETLSVMQIGGVVRLVKRIIVGTVIVETVGALLLAFRFCPEFGFARGVWYAIFHSVSAFCNAGFDLMGNRAPFSSFTNYTGDILVNITILLLIVIGGIGFVVWDDMMRNKHHFRKYNLHTKIMLSFSAGLILFSTVLLLFTERSSPAFEGLTIQDRFLAALFHAITPRTAGFNTVDTAQLSQAGSFLTMMLMFIGAGPGSTGGGIKVTTFAAVVLSVAANAKRKADVNLYHRRLTPEQTSRAYSSTAFYAFLVVGGCFILCASQAFSFGDALFETLSAIGTVGLTKGITPELPLFSKLAIILLMYAGRLGSLTVFMAIVERSTAKQIRNPIEKIIVG